jgi:hypothetical protein
MRRHCPLLAKLLWLSFTKYPCLHVNPSERLADQILITVFQGVFHLFLLLSLELLRTYTTCPPNSLTVILGVFFAFYAIVEACASYVRHCYVLRALGEC